MKTWILLALGTVACATPTGEGDALARAIEAIVEREPFRASQVSACFVPLAGGPPLYARNAEKLMIPGSTTKLVTAGTALWLLGPDHRFRTVVRATGGVRDGELEGDLVLVASGDPSLSARLRPDGTLAFRDHDHSYANVLPAQVIAGDPLAVLRELARQTAEKGIRRVQGAVRVDAGLFPEGEREHGTGVTISPVALNDNVIDVFLAPGAAAGEPAHLCVSPETAYARFVNATTTTTEGPAELVFDARREEDGSFTVTAAGSIALAAPERLFVYPVETPSRFAEFAFAEALRDAGVDARPVSATEAGSTAAAEGEIVAEHLSAPFSEEVRLTLKTSQNLHAAMMPYLLGALLAGEHKDSEEAGFARMNAFLTGAGLDLAEACQSDGEGGPGCLFSARFLTSYLAFLARQEHFPLFEGALPVLGRDGTLADTLRDSPLAGNLRAKTGTHVLGNSLGAGLVITGKGLAGTMTTASGRRVAFAVFLNQVPVEPSMDRVLEVGAALVEMAEAVYRLR